LGLSVDILALLLGLLALLAWDFARGRQAAEHSQGRIPLATATASDEPQERTPASQLAARAPRSVAPALVPHPEVKVENPTPSQAAYNKGVEAQRKGEHVQAIGHFTEALTNAPKDLRALYNRALAHRSAGEPAAAVKDLGELLKVEPRDVQALASRGGILLGMKDYAGAAADFGKVIELQPSSQAFLQRGLAHMHRGESKSAEEDFTRAIELDSKNTDAPYYRGLIYLEGKKFDAAIKDFDKVAALRPTEKVFFERGLARYQKEDFAAAVKDLSRAVEEDPKDADAHYYLGAVYLHDKDYQRAIAPLSEAVRLRTASPAAFQRGLAYYYLGQYRPAADDFTAALVADSGSYAAHLNRGLTRFQLQENEGALVDFTRATELRPQAASAYRARSQLYHRLGQEDRAQADSQKATQLEAGSGR
jgi:serine/threonine-protein kinase